MTSLKKYIYQMCKMYNICKQNAENIRETRNFVLKRHRNTYTKLCKNDILGTYIYNKTRTKSHTFTFKILQYIHVV